MKKEDVEESEQKTKEEKEDKILELLTSLVNMCDTAYNRQVNIKLLEIKIKNLEEHNKKMKEALEHTLKVFKSMSNRGAYPRELLPFMVFPETFKDEPLFLGKQGFMYIIDAINNKE